jgi:hypothetical protein
LREGFHYPGSAGVEVQLSATDPGGLDQTGTFLLVADGVCGVVAYVGRLMWQTEKRFMAAFQGPAYFKGAMPFTGKCSSTSVV